MKHKAATDTANLGTEQRNPATQNLDLRSALEIARILNAEDAKVAGAVKKALPQIARAIDAIADALANGGRLIYVGTGTSGRLGALDAAECPPTFGTDPRPVQFVIAGGVKALGAAVEASEDSAPKRTRRHRQTQARQSAMWWSASPPADALPTPSPRSNTPAPAARQQLP